MSEVAMLRGSEPKQILRTAIEKRVPAIMTYLSEGKWRVAKVFLTGLSSDRLDVEGTDAGEKQHPINIQAHQPVGLSFKYGYGKFVFDTTVFGLEPAMDPASQGWGGTIVLALPDRIRVVQRRSYFRVSVPESLKVSVVLWPARREAGSRDETENETQDTKAQAHNYFHGRLVDISAGGARVVLDARQVTSGEYPESSGDFKKGRLVGVRFTPMPYETPLMFNAQIRNVSSAAEDNGVDLRLQIIGLEASPKDRKVLSQLVGVVERYFKINQSGAKQQDMQMVGVGLRARPGQL